MTPPKSNLPRTERVVYEGVDRMVRGTFQCWGTANDLIGHDDIEGCGAGGGVQGLALALDAQSEWRDLPRGRQLRIHLLFTRRIRAKAEAPFIQAAPMAAELLSFLPNEGKVVFVAHQPIGRVAVRLPGSADFAAAKCQRFETNEPSRPPASGHTPSLRWRDRPREGQTAWDGPYAVIENVLAGERVVIQFPLRRDETVERAAGKEYHAQWKGNSIVSLEPHGEKVPLCRHGETILKTAAPLGAPRYP